MYKKMTAVKAPTPQKPLVPMKYTGVSYVHSPSNCVD